MNAALSFVTPSTDNPMYAKGLHIYPGDVIRQTTDGTTLVVAALNDDQHALAVYDTDADCVRQVPPRIVWETISESGSWESFWHCIGREVRTILDGTMFRTFVVQAHLVFTEDSAGGLDHSVCFSWGEFPGDRLRDPLEMDWVKYRDTDNLLAALSAPYTDETFVDICEWMEVSNHVAEMMQDLIHAIDGMRHIRTSDVDALLNNPELVS
jgi:hypothetical protein